MTTLQNISWETFKNTGSIDAYLFYKSIQPTNIKGGTDGKYSSEGDCNQTSKLW